MKTNRTIATTFPLTHEGGRASIITPEQELRRTVMACMLWEGSLSHKEEKNENKPNYRHHIPAHS